MYSVLLPTLKEIAKHTGFTAITVAAALATDDGEFIFGGVNYGETNETIPRSIDQWDPELLSGCYG